MSLRGHKLKSYSVKCTPSVIFQSAISSWPHPANASTCYNVNGRMEWTKGREPIKNGLSCTENRLFTINFGAFFCNVTPDWRPFGFNPFFLSWYTPSQ